MKPSSAFSKGGDATCDHSFFSGQFEATRFWLKLSVMSVITGVMRASHILRYWNSSLKGQCHSVFRCDGYGTGAHEKQILGGSQEDAQRME